MFSIFAVVFQTVTALLSLAWAPVAVLRVKENKTIRELVPFFIWNMCWLGLRATSFAMLAAYSKPYLIMVLLTHIIAMVFWLWHDDDKFKVIGAIATVLFMYYYHTKSDSSCLAIFNLFYNIIVSYENAFSIGLFFIDPTLNVTNCVIMLTLFYLGIGIIFVFKFTKASSLIPLPQTCVLPADTTPDTMPDTTYDTTPDTTYDVTPDTTSDTTFDTTYDATPDTTFDTTYDTTPDTTSDTTFDTTYDATSDTTFYTTYDATPDMTFDMT